MEQIIFGYIESLIAVGFIGLFLDSYITIMIELEDKKELREGKE